MRNYRGALLERLRNGRTLAVLRPLASFLGRFLRPLSRWRRRPLHGRRFIALPHQVVARLVTVILVVDIPLLFGLRVALAGIVSLVDR